MHFSSLADSLTAPKNPLYLLHDELRAAGEPILDLVKGNVNEHGIVYPQDVLRQILLDATERARVYKPDSLGQIEAREAISAYYENRIPSGTDSSSHRAPAFPTGTASSYSLNLEMKSLHRNRLIPCSTILHGCAA